jgi:hypothetical protein
VIAGSGLSPSSWLGKSNATRPRGKRHKASLAGEHCLSRSSTRARSTISPGDFAIALYGSDLLLSGSEPIHRPSHVRAWRSASSVATQCRVAFDGTTPPTRSDRLSRRSSTPPVPDASPIARPVQSRRAGHPKVGMPLRRASIVNRQNPPGRAPVEDSLTLPEGSTRLRYPGSMLSQ